MTDETTAAAHAAVQNDLHVGKWFRFDLTDASVKEVVAGAEHVFDRFLAWSSQNPILAVAFFVLIGWGVYQWRKATTDDRAQKVELERLRGDVKPVLTMKSPPKGEETTS